MMKQPNLGFADVKHNLLRKLYLTNQISSISPVTSYDCPIGQIQHSVASLL